MDAKAPATWRALATGGPVAASTPRGADPLTPRAHGLYDPANEHDSCGVGFVADMKNRKSHAILEKGLEILVNLDHRGATGADATLGDGCGVLTQEWSTSPWRDSWNAGIGGEVALRGGASFFVEARYQRIAPRDSDMQFVPIRFGVRF